MEAACSTELLTVKSVEACVVPPCLPSPKGILSLSDIDNQQILRRVFDRLLVYNACDNISADPAKIIREALSKVLVHYYPLAGRLRKKENGTLQVECTGEGALFLEATADNRLSVLGDLDDLRPSFRQLLFKFPANTDVEDLHPLVLQVMLFICGGFVLGVSFHHSICDGRGAGNFLKSLAEMARGDVKPSVEPIWNRELLKLKKSKFNHLEMIIESKCDPHPPIKYEELVQASLFVDSDIIKKIKQCIMEECKHLYSTFEVAAALAWRARTKALDIPHTQSVKLLFPVDVRRSYNPPLPNGYYGNGINMACGVATVHDLINGPLSHTLNIIHKSKISSSIETWPFGLDIFTNQNNLILSDWRWLGFNEVDFGWGGAVNVSPTQLNEDGIAIPNVFLFLHPAKNKSDGIKILVCTSPLIIKSFEMEKKSIIKKNVA